MGQGIYLSMYGKASALLHSLTRTTAWSAATKRLAWLATVVFCYINGVHRIIVSRDRWLTNYCHMDNEESVENINS